MVSFEVSGLLPNIGRDLMRINRLEATLPIQQIIAVIHEMACVRDFERLKALASVARRLCQEPVNYCELFDYAIEGGPKPVEAILQNIRELIRRVDVKKGKSKATGRYPIDGKKKKRKIKTR
jgi:hypothetical protein